MKVPFTGANSRRKEHLLRGIDLKSARGMELGPFYSPTILKSEGDITYVDRLSAAQLIERHQKADPTSEFIAHPERGSSEERRELAAHYVVTTGCR